MPRKSVRQESLDQVFEDINLISEFLDTDDEEGLEEAIEIVVNSCVEIYVKPIPCVPKSADGLIQLLQRYGKEFLIVQVRS